MTNENKFEIIAGAIEKTAKDRGIDLTSSHTAWSSLRDEIFIFLKSGKSVNELSDQAPRGGPSAVFVYWIQDGRRRLVELFDGEWRWNHAEPIARTQP